MIICMLFILINLMFQLDLKNTWLLQNKITYSRGKLDENLGSIKFEKFFYPNEYIEHYGGQGHAGGRLVEYKDDYFLMAHQIIYYRDAREIYKIQDPNSNFGKLLKINMKEVISFFNWAQKHTKFVLW